MDVSAKLSLSTSHVGAVCVVAGDPKLVAEGGGAGSQEGRRRVEQGSLIPILLDGGYWTMGPGRFLPSTS